MEWSPSYILIGSMREDPYFEKSHFSLKAAYQNSLGF